MCSAIDDNKDIGGNKKEEWDERWAHTALMENCIPGPVWRKRVILGLLRRYAVRASLVADFGCGCGVFLSYLAQTMPEVQLVGVDQSETGVAYAQRQTPSAKFFLGDLSQSKKVFLEELRNKVDVGVCSEVLEHMENPAAALQNIKSCLVPREGTLIVTVPGGPLTPYKKNLGHLRHYTRKSLEALLRQAGFDVIDTLAAGFPFYNIYELLIWLRGRRLIKEVDAAHSDFSGMPAGVRAASAALRFLMRFNINAVPWGWQIIAAARKRQEGS
ncbi:MAG: class I SAM-dependent methyltransferase [Synergistaceae bacterium]|nr:class I SAM-dependent methyltransferase [Synergistaceae bacterium]